MAPALWPPLIRLVKCWQEEVMPMLLAEPQAALQAEPVPQESESGFLRRRVDALPGPALGIQCV